MVNMWQNLILTVDNNHVDQDHVYCRHDEMNLGRTDQIAALAPFSKPMATIKTCGILLFVFIINRFKIT